MKFDVWMSLASIPASFKAAKMAFMAAVLAVSASPAVAAWLMTPALTEAMSGTILTSPWPDNEITLGIILISSAWAAGTTVAASKGGEGGGSDRVGATWDTPWSLTVMTPD